MIYYVIGRLMSGILALSYFVLAMTLLLRADLLPKPVTYAIAVAFVLALSWLIGGVMIAASDRWKERRAEKAARKQSQFRRWQSWGWIFG